MKELRNAKRTHKKKTDGGGLWKTLLRGPVVDRAVSVMLSPPPTRIARCWAQGDAGHRASNCTISNSTMSPTLHIKIFWWRVYGTDTGHGTANHVKCIGNELKWARTVSWRATMTATPFPWKGIISFYNTGGKIELYSDKLVVAIPL